MSNTDELLGQLTTLLDDVETALARRLPEQPDSVQMILTLDGREIACVLISCECRHIMLSFDAQVFHNCGKTGVPLPIRYRRISASMETDLGDIVGRMVIAKKPPICRIKGAVKQDMVDDAVFWLTGAVLS